MSLSKIFKIEFLCGIIFLSFPIRSLFVPPSPLVMDIASVVYLILFLAYLNYAYRKYKKEDAVERLVLQVGSVLSIVILTVVTLSYYFFEVHIRTYADEPLKKYWPFFVVPSYLLLHSTIVFILLNFAPAKNRIKNLEKSFIDIFNSDTYIEIKQGFFLLIILLGLVFLIFDYWQIQRRNLFVFFPVIFMLIYVYDYKSKVKGKLKRPFDEREKYYLYKTASIATFFFIISLCALFAIKDIKLLNYPINDMWGVFVFPMFLFIWGIVGLIITYKAS
jgi:hypothetical protein